MTQPLGRLRLGVNIDHVATIRNARGGETPSPVRAAILAQQAGADGITAHSARRPPPHHGWRHRGDHGRHFDPAEF